MTDDAIYPLTEHSLDKSPIQLGVNSRRLSWTKESSNPMGTDGPSCRIRCTRSRVTSSAFEMLGFSPIAQHRSKDVTLYNGG